MVSRQVLARFMALLLVVATLAGCSTSNVRATGACPQELGTFSKYVIGPGDVLQIFVWRHEELSTSLPVRPDGRISMPLAEDVVAVGRTPTELARDIEVELAEYLRTPKVNIIVASQGTANQIQVVGNVRSPQSLGFRDGIRLLDVIVAVGGLDDFAAGNRSKIVRQIDGESVECKVRISDLMKDGDIEQNVFLYPGDVIVVPQSRF